MTLRSGRQFLSIPGPTTVPDEVLQAMHRPAVDIYGGAHGGELYGMTTSCLADISKIFKTKGDTYIYIANGHGAWEGALANTLSPGDTVLTLESGRFAIGWGAMAEKMGVNIETVPNDWRHAVDPNKVEEALRADTERKIKAVLVVQIDTASSCVNDIPAIRAAMDAAGHDAMLMVDTIASLACMDYDMDGWGIDVSVGGSQKGLMTPPGLSFVAASDKAKEAQKTAGCNTSYWDWTARDEDEHYRKYCGTPPVHLLFGLRKAIDMLFEEGLDNVIRRHALLAGAVHAAIDVWSSGGAFEYNMLQPEERAVSVTTLRTAENVDPAEIRRICVETFGVTLGQGIGDLSGKAFRIGHMGHVNAPMMLGTLGSVETALEMMGAIDGASTGGISAATKYLAEQLKG